MSKISEYLLTGANMAYFSISFTLIVVALFVVFYVARFNYCKKHGIAWTGLKVNTKNLTYISMMVAVSVTLTVIISLTIPVTVFPPIRIAFSGIMIKITGVFFGPIIGLLVGMITELLCLLFVPSYIHIAYFLVALSFGFWSGLTAYTIKLKGRKCWWTFLVLNAYLVIFSIIMYLIQSKNVLPDSNFFGIKIPKEFTATLFVLMMAITLSMIWFVSLVLIFLKKNQLLEVVLPIFLLCIITETLTTILLASWGDSEILGIPKMQGGYTSMVIVRLLQMPVKVGFNCAILTTVYTVMNPIVKRGLI